ncbi:MAG TPA: protein translocase subunit SecF [Burkholderiaceae bacterium]|jgi:preprotein translocase subunit SecF|nr:protein translocase subunit SecF [Burkholderiaceae bacterium]
MEFFRIRRTIPFMRYSLYFNAASAVTFLIAVGFLIFRGLNLSIEFTGGTVMEVSYRAPADVEKIRSAITRLGWGDFQVQSFGTASDVLIRLPARPGFSSGQQAEIVMTALTAQPSPAEAPECAALHAAYADFVKRPQAERSPSDSAALVARQRELSGRCTELRRVEFVGPQVGSELAYDGSLALLCVCLGIMFYLAVRFEWKFSVAAIIANLHDVVLVIGMFSIFQWEFSLPVLAAVLAVLGYSVNESVIIFDRVREHFRTMRKATATEVIDSAITATISRTIITHGCTLMMTVTMLLFGGPALHYFALALTLGICFGVYSSVFVAAAIARYLGVKREDLVKPVKKDEQQAVL